MHVVPKHFGALVNRFYPINIEEQKREERSKSVHRSLSIEVWVLWERELALASGGRSTNVVEKLFLSRFRAVRDSVQRVWGTWTSENSSHPPFRLSNDRTNVEDAATGAGGTRAAGLHPDTHRASQYLRNQIGVRLSVQVSRSPWTVHQGGAGETGPFTRNRCPAEDQSRSTARRCFSGWDSRSNVIIFPFERYNVN